MTEPEERGATTAATAAAGAEIATSASLWSDAWRELRGRITFWVASVIMLIMVTMAVFPSLFTSNGPNQGCDANRAKQRPESWNPLSGDHPFGFDLHGCDYWSQVVNGARAPIFIGFAVTAMALLIAIVFGSLAGYYGGWLDAIISRITDIFFALPLVLGALLMLTSLFPSHEVWQVAFVLACFWWTTMTRIMRGQAITVRNADYVQAARLLGASDLRIMGVHILPNAFAPVYVYAMLNVGVVIGSEATLDFLGVGLQYPTVSWGSQMSEAQNIILDYPYLLIYPGLFLTATVLSFLLLGDAIRDALDPKQR